MRVVQMSQNTGFLSGFIGLLMWLVLGFVWLAGAQARAGDVILIVRPDKPNTYAHATFEHAMEGLQEGLGDEILTFSFHISQNTPTSELRIFLDVVNPRLVVLMDNKSVRLYREYQHDFPERAPFTPSVILMSLFVEQQVEAVANSVGIEYQIQGITSLVNFRSLVDTPLDRVGVVYRDETSDFFKQQQSVCRREEIELVGIKVGRHKDKVRPRDIRHALKRLLVKEKVKAIWMLNDSLLINRKLLETAWRPVIQKYKAPVIVGIERFVTEEDLVGHFAVVPDPFGMGDQAADMILALKEDNWKIGRDRVRLPISVYKLLNARKLPNGLAQKLNDKGLLEVDRIIQ